ncbi:MAG: nuclear transport factor 2 family protein [Cytophagaceae bacterium]|nr:nuclear transport factor 2 family protein [Cytophagaceae bacterium]
MKKSLLGLVLLLALSTVAFAQTNDEKAVASAVETLKKAMIDADRTNLDRLASSDLSYGHSNGLVEDKAAFIEALASGKSDFVTIDLTGQTIRMTGDVAVVRHKLSARTSNDGKPGTANLAVLLVWQKQKGAWVLLARQAVKI